MSAQHPRRVDGLEVSEVSDGLVVYQGDPDRVHYLNRTAAVVYELCDGRRDLDELARLLAATFGLEAAPVAEVRGCVAELREKGVLA